jgi:hypothetical protein
MPSCLDLTKVKKAISIAFTLFKNANLCKQFDDISNAKGGRIDNQMQKNGKAIGKGTILA